MGAVHARIEPLATEQRLQYERMMSQWVALYRHLISQRLLMLERAVNAAQNAKSATTLIERQQLARLSALVDEMQASLRESDRQKTEQLNNQLLDAIRSYDSAPSLSPNASAPISGGGGRVDARPHNYRQPKLWYLTKGHGWTYHF